MIPGKPYVFADGVTRVLPALTLRQMREFGEDGTIAKMADVSNPREAASATLQVLFAALVRNYPEVQRDQVEDLLDPGLVGAMTECLLGRVKPEDRVSDPGPKAGSQ